MLSGIANINDSDGTHEIEIWSTDVDVSTILNQTEHKIALGQFI